MLQRVSALAAIAALACGVSINARAQDSSAPAAPAQTFVQVGRLLADPASGRVERNKTLVISAGKIVEIRDGLQTGAGETIDLRDSFVLPGLIDSHVHLTGENGPSARLDAMQKTAVDSAMDGALHARTHARSRLHHGCSISARTRCDLRAARCDRGRQGRRPAHHRRRRRRMRMADTATSTAIGGHLKLFADPGLCSGADDCRRAVRQAVQRGADVIKIASTGGVMSNTAAGVGQQMTDDELRPS